MKTNIAPVTLLGLFLLSPIATAKEAAKIPARLTCTVKFADGKTLTLPHKSKPRIEDDPVRCVLSLASGDHPLTGTIQTLRSDGGKNVSGPAHSGPVAAGPSPQELTAELKPETEFVGCDNFKIQAELKDGETIVWTKTLNIIQNCPD
jgi:hypothetical protein